MVGEKKRLSYQRSILQIKPELSVTKLLSLYIKKKILKNLLVISATKNESFTFRVISAFHSKVPFRWNELEGWAKGELQGNEAYGKVIKTNVCDHSPIMKIKI